MPGTNQGALRLFRFAGVDVFLHWSWFLVAVFEINGGLTTYSSKMWNGLEYLALFAIVLLHEYGHALACKSVGGTANRIMLWPLGGVAYVDPPQRPGATLWSIAAGPLVNVALVPVFLMMGAAFRSAGISRATDLYTLLHSVAMINAGLLIFNLLPIYPLDGGQIVRSLLWFIFGRGRSLTIASVFGLVGVVGLIVFAIKIQSVWFAVISFFILVNCWSGLQQARLLSNMEKLPRRHEFACPECKASPPIGAVWRCSACTSLFDTFATNAQCPTCGTRFDKTACLDCRALHPISEWSPGAVVVNPDYKF